jgi:trans-feruloyl-CoA hydratase/vanillin synthase
MTGETFTGKQAAAMGLVNESVPAEQLEKRVRELAKVLMQKDPVVLRAAKEVFKRVRYMDWETANDYIYAKSDGSQYRSGGEVRSGAMHAFLDDKKLKPGLATFQKAKKGDKKTTKKTDNSTKSVKAPKKNGVGKK